MAATSSRPGALLGVGAESAERPAPRSARSRVKSRLAWLCLLAAAALVVLSYYAPWWTFALYAPQYPHGLKLEVWLSRVSGDVHEINMLNHYIGMASLTRAAPLERALAGYAVPGLAAALVLAFVALRGRARWLALGFASLLPLGFLLDSFYWLRRFGHDLDPRAPIELPPFTPQLFGNGQIGQFLTFARPMAGFWMGVLAAALVAVALWLSEQDRRGVRSPVAGAGRSERAG